MAITKAQTNATGQSAGAVASLNAVFGASPTQNNLIVVTATSDSTMNLPSGSGWSEAVNSVSNCGLYIWYKVAGASESATITVNNVASATCVVCAMEWAGLLTSSVLDKTATQGSTSGGNIPSGTTATLSQASELAICAMANFDSGGSLTSFTNGYTTEYDLRPASGAIKDEGMAGSLITSATTAQSSTAQLSAGAGSGSTGCIATFKAAAAGASSAVPRSPWRARLPLLVR